MTVRRFEKTAEASFPLGKIKLCLLLAVILLWAFSGPTFAQQSPAAPEGGDRLISKDQPDREDDSSSPLEARLKGIEKTLNDMKVTGERSERRSLENKLIGRELTAWVKAVFLALIIIAVSFPITIWLVSRKRLLGLPGLSDEVAATFLVVEERQTKLANVLKEIQTEVEYLHSSAAPDLKNLLEEAEKYLEQNKRDLEHVGNKR